MSNRIHLGLDLQGGAHLILQVQVSEAINDETDNTVQDIQQDLKKANLSFSQVYQARPNEAGVIRSRGHRARTIRCRKLAAGCSKFSNEYDLSRRLPTITYADHEADFENDLEGEPSTRPSRPFATGSMRWASASR